MSNSRPDAESEYVVRARWLATTSVVLGFLVEVLPIEADFSYGHLFGFPTTICGILAVKLICISVIVTPLLLYVVFNGYRGLRHVRGHVFTVCTIITVRFVADAIAMISILRGAII